MRRVLVAGVCTVLALVVTRELQFSLPIAGIGPDLVILVVVAFGAHSRPASATGIGFFAGILRDLLTTLPVGSGAIVYALAGYAASLIGPPGSVWLTVGVVAGVSVASHLLLALAAISMGSDLALAVAFKVPVVIAAYNAILSPILFPGVARAAALTSPTAET